MKTAKVKPFGMLKVTDEVLKSIEDNSSSTEESKASFKDVIKQAQQDKFSGQFYGLDPDSKNLFTFIPIIEDERFFISAFPDPIQLYFSQAYSNYQSSLQVRRNIVFKKTEGNPMNMVNGYLYNWYIKSKISAIIFLHSTCEAFINNIMPDDFIYKQEINGEKGDKFLKQTKEFNKEQTERTIGFKEKMKFVVPQISGINFQKDFQKIYDNIINLNSLRNDLIHLRSSKEKNMEYFQKIFSELVNVNLEPYVKSVEEFINTIKPNFIEYSDQKIFDDNAKFTFNFETFGAFKLGIEVFLQILDCPAKYIQLNIPKADDLNYNTAIDWITQNLNTMAEQQLIFFPIVEENEKDLVFKIIKTDKKIGVK